MAEKDWRDDTLVGGDTISDADVVEFLGLIERYEDGSLQDADGDTKIQVEESADEDIIRFDTGGTERVIIDSTGVGIGTSSPATKLNISGGALQINNTGLIQLGGDNGRNFIVRADSAEAYFDLSDTLTQDYNFRFIVDPNWGEYAGMLYYPTGGSEYLMCKFVATGTIFNPNAVNLDFTACGDNDTALLVCDASADKVGVGTASPATKLHVAGAITFNELSADPSNPAEGSAVIWMSDGTGAGDDGDILIKITAGSTTKTATLVDFSAV